MLETPLAGKAPDEPPDPSIRQPSQIIPDPFVFVPVTGNEARRGRGAANRLVRAHVTRIQHAKSGTLRSMHDLQNWTVRPYIHRTMPLPIRPRAKRSDDSSKSGSEEEGEKEGQEASRGVGMGIMKIVDRLPTGSAHDDPFWTYPVDYQPALSPIFAHYIQNIAVEIPDIDGPHGKGLLRRRWFPLAMTDAATMYAVLLMAASHYYIVNPSQAKLVDLLALKARALSEINTALTSHQGTITDAMVGAVAKMAAYEAIFGDSDVFAAHMKGLQMMLKLRGGLGTLGLDGLLERLVVWIDLNAAHITGRAATLGGDAFPTQVSFAAPDPFHFAGIS